MAEPTPGQTMEDILASIRRIIAEEPPAPAIPDAEPDDNVLELGPESSPPPLTDLPAAPAPIAPSVPPPAAAPAMADVEQASREALERLPGLSINPQADANTLDGLVRELLRPLLKQWLDSHLPELVERVVTREIARIGTR